MRDYNKSIFSGRLTADPDLKNLPGGTSYVGVSVAINSQRGTGDQKKDHVDFIDVAIYGEQAEHVAKYLKKGSPVLIEGKLAQQRWMDKASGMNRSKVGVVAVSVQFLGRPQGGRQEFNPEDVPPDVSETFSGADAVGEEQIPF